MPEQCDNIDREMHGRDTRQHGRNRSPQPQRSHAMEVDDSRNAPAARTRVMESNAPGSWRGPDALLMSIDAIDIAALILPDWEIKGTTNLPLHMCGCQDCLRFIEHVRQNLQGGALSVTFLGCDTLFSSYCRSPVAHCTEPTYIVDVLLCAVVLTPALYGSL
jgi:hypothetical protein